MLVGREMIVAFWFFSGGSLILGFILGRIGRSDLVLATRSIDYLRDRCERQARHIGIVQRQNTKLCTKIQRLKCRLRLLAKAETK